MPEITDTDRGDVAAFLEETFGLASDAAQDYAKIAVFLSDDDRCEQRLTQLSDDLQTAYWSLLYTDLSVASKVQSNLLTRAIQKVAEKYQFGAHYGAIFAGFIDSEKFKDYVRGQLLWKDAVSSNHGEHSHSFQWLMIAAEFGGALTQSVTYRYQKSVNHDSKEETKFRSPARPDPVKIVLWDFLVDCFDHGFTPDYKKNITSHTCRSPTYLNKKLARGTTWLGDYLKGRYAKRGWQPVLGDGAPTDIREHAQKKHTNSRYTQVANNIFTPKGPKQAKADTWAPVGVDENDTVLIGSLIQSRSGWKATDWAYRVQFANGGLLPIDTSVDVAALLGKDRKPPLKVRFRVHRVGSQFQAHALQDAS